MSETNTQQRYERRHEPVTVLFNRTAKEGREREFEDWNKQLIHICEQQPGHLMTSVVAEGNRRYITLQQFDSHQHLQDWLQSPQRLERLPELKELTEEALEPSELNGMEPWFRLPGQQGGKGHVPRWKMAVVVFCTIYIFILLLSTFVAPHIRNWPLPLRTVVFPLVMVPTMTYLILPRLTRWLRSWLYG